MHDDDMDLEPSVEHTARMDEWEVATSVVPVADCTHEELATILLGDERVPACVRCGVAEAYLDR